MYFFCYGGIQFFNECSTYSLIKNLRWKSNEKVRWKFSITNFNWKHTFSMFWIQIWAIKIYIWKYLNFQEIKKYYSSETCAINLREGHLMFEGITIPNKKKWLVLLSTKVHHSPISSKNSPFFQWTRNEYSIMEKEYFLNLVLKLFSDISPKTTLCNRK